MALGGISNIGQEMYFQQPSANSGATGIMANYQTNANALKEQQRQYNTNRQDAKDAEPSTLERLGGGLANYVQGNMAAGGQAMMSMSDERSKQDVKPFKRGISELRQLDPVVFSYNGKFDMPQGLPGVSVMAQQLEKVMPEAVVKVNTSDGPARAILPLALQMATINAINELDMKISAFSKRK
jgi:hypothetical protein